MSCRIPVLACLVSTLLTAASNSRADQPLAPNQSMSYALVYSARVPANGGFSTDQLEQIARDRGSIESLTFTIDGDPCAPLERILAREGEAGLAYPGFSVKVHELFAQRGLLAPNQVTNTAIQFAGHNVTIGRTPPQNDLAPVRVTYAVAGQVLIKIETHVVGKASDEPFRPRLIKTTGLDGDTDIVQVFDYFGAPPAADVSPMVVWPDQVDVATDSASTPAGQTEYPGSLPGSRSSDSVDFGPQCRGVGGLGFDTGWAPGSDARCDSPVEFRAIFGASASLCADVQGNISLNASNPSDPRLQLGSGSGYVEVDLGVELGAQGSVCVNLPFPLPDLDHTFNIPYVPNFDLRIFDRTNFSSFLLDGCATASDSIGMQNLFCIDLVPIPGVSASVCASASISGSAQMCGQSIGLSDGTTFTSEGQSRSINMCTGYHKTATYNESLTVTGTVTLAPTLCVGFLTFEWCLPVIQFPWNVISNTPVDIPFNTSGVDFNDDLRRTWYRDADGDGCGDPNNTTQACSQPSGYVSNSNDQCPNDPNKCTSTGQCGCGVPEGSLQTWYRDADGDGCGDPNDSMQACSQPSGFVSNANDQCPSDPNKCSSLGQCGCGVPESNFQTWYRDADGDDCGDPNDSMQACSQPPGFVASANDQCPSDPNKCASPGQCGCGVPESNFRTWYRDADGDGCGDPNDSMQSCTQPPGFVANDNDALPNDGGRCTVDCPNGNCDQGENPCNCPQDCGEPPSSETNCSDGIDNDCDGLIDSLDDDCRSECENGPDSDSDGVCDSEDDCPGTPFCAEVDANGCPTDDDGDLILNGCDNCRGVANPGQEDSDGNGVGDVCEEEPPSQPCPDGTCGPICGVCVPLGMLLTCICLIGAKFRYRRRRRASP